MNWDGFNHMKPSQPATSSLNSLINLCFNVKGILLKLTHNLMIKKNIQHHNRKTLTIFFIKE